MSALYGVFAAAQSECGRTHRIVWRAAGNDPRQLWIFAADGSGRRPSRPDKFALDALVSGPGHAGFADTDREAQRVAAVNHVVKSALAGINDDGAG